MTLSSEDITAKIEAIAQRNPVYTGVVQWVGDLLSTTVQAAGEFRLSDMDLGAKNVPETWYQGKSLIDLECLILNWQPIKDLFRKLLDQVKTKDPANSQVGGLLKVLDEDQNSATTLMKSMLTLNFNLVETTARKLEIDPQVLALFLRLSMRPILLKAAQTLTNGLNLSRWNYGHCPVCGSAPKLADLSGEGGKRTLHCSLCETAWPYPRLRCPFCENDNREDLSYLKAENEEGLRVDLCSRCGQHLKTIDLRELPGPIIVPLDDVATWHLDLIAQENLKDKGADKARTV